MTFYASARKYLSKPVINPSTNTAVNETATMIIRGAWLFIVFIIAVFIIGVIVGGSIYGIKKLVDKAKEKRGSPKADSTQGDNQTPEDSDKKTPEV